MIGQSPLCFVKGPRGTFSINSQRTQVKVVCKEAILNFEVGLVFHGCFPLIVNCICMGKASVIHAVTDLHSTKILARIKEDLLYYGNIIMMVCIIKTF
jgi:hypothetical protein